MTSVRGILMAEKMLEKKSAGAFCDRSRSGSVCVLSVHYLLATWKSLSIFVCPQHW